LDPEAAYSKEPSSSRIDLDSWWVVERLHVELTELVDVPRAADVVTFKCLEAVQAWSNHHCNREGTLPWQAELV
jgi:hypothetical protein